MRFPRTILVVPVVVLQVVVVGLVELVVASPWRQVLVSRKGVENKRNSRSSNESLVRLVLAVDDVSLVLCRSCNVSFATTRVLQDGWLHLKCYNASTTTP